MYINNCVLRSSKARAFLMLYKQIHTKQKGNNSSLLFSVFVHHLSLLGFTTKATVVFSAKVTSSSTLCLLCHLWLSLFFCLFRWDHLSLSHGCCQAEAKVRCLTLQNRAPYEIPVFTSLTTGTVIKEAPAWLQNWSLLYVL